MIFGRGRGIISEVGTNLGPGDCTNNREENQQDNEGENEGKPSGESRHINLRWYGDWRGHTRSWIRHHRSGYAHLTA